MYVLVMCMCLTPLCRHQGIEGKIMLLEKKLAELKAQDMPLSNILRQAIQTLCAEEVGFVRRPRSHKTYFPT